MAREVSNRAAPSAEPSAAKHAAGQEMFSKWLLFSLIVHGALIVGMFVMPSLPTRSAPHYPVYSVDLVGGEKIGGMRFGTEVAPRPTKQVTKRAEAEPPAPVAKAKPEPKKEKAEKPKVVEKAPPQESTVVAKPVEKTPPPRESTVVAKPVEKTPPPRESTAVAKPVEKAPPPQESVAVAEKPQNEEKPQAATAAKGEAADDALERVRERLIQSAVERVKSRAESTQKSAGSQTNKGGEALSSGPGEGDGAAALGSGGRGGGSVRGIDFVAYQAKLFETIRANWAWVGHRSDLRVVVRFGIKDNGEIVGLRIVQPSGDASYDDSVLRALRKSSPFPAPPEDYRRDFANVELAFRPKDLGA